MNRAENVQEVGLPLDQYAGIWENEHVMIRYNAVHNLMWSEWKGVIPTKKLREGITRVCELINEKGVELVLADYGSMSPPAIEDQLWIVNHSTLMLSNSRLRKVANLMTQDIYQDITIESLSESAANFTLPCVYNDFYLREDAMKWLLSK